MVLLFKTKMGHKVGDIKSVYKYCYTPVLFKNMFVWFHYVTITKEYVSEACSIDGLGTVESFRWKIIQLKVLIGDEICTIN